MKQQLKTISVMLLAAAVMAGCGKSAAEERAKADAEQRQETGAKGQSGQAGQVDQAVQGQEFSAKDLLYVKNAVHYQAELLNKSLEKIKLPSLEKGFRNSPVSTATWIDQKISLQLRLEDRSGGQGKSEGTPLNIRVVPNDGKTYKQFKDEGFKVQTVDGKEYLVGPDSGKAQLVYIDGDFIYDLDSVSYVMNFSGRTYSVEELIKIARGMTADSEYKKYFQLDLSRYKVPSYFVNDGKEPYWIMVSYHHDDQPQNFAAEGQSLQISNDSARFEQWTPLNELAKEVYGEEMTIEGHKVVKDPDSNVIHLFNGGKFYDFSPKTEADQETGKVMYTEIPNWDAEIAKTIKTLGLSTEEDNIGAATPKESSSGVSSEQIDKESRMRREAVKAIYSDALLDESVFTETLLKFTVMGPDIDVPGMQEELYSRYAALNKDLNELKLSELPGLQLEPETVKLFKELVQFGGFEDSGIYYMKDEIKGGPTLYWVLAMVQSYEGYQVLNVYDPEREGFLTDL
ncbi:MULTISPECIES: hypothetical protein [Paenibacillus]|uniref:hypothetical protein n=1 Tax=Paenibacillus TaxID=44249 RepID=UPI002FE2FEC7